MLAYVLAVHVLFTRGLRFDIGKACRSISLTSAGLLNISSHFNLRSVVKVDGVSSHILQSFLLFFIVTEQCKHSALEVVPFMVSRILVLHTD